MIYLKPNSNIMLEAICYAVEQTYSSHISIGYPADDDSDDENCSNLFMQLKQLVDIFDEQSKLYGIGENTAKTIEWYAEDLFDKIRAAHNIDEIYK
jgi:hypothetical protein